MLEPKMPARRSTRSQADGPPDPRELAALLDRLREGADRLGVPLDDEKVAKLERYRALLAEWGRTINLTSLHDPGSVVVRHFLDSLALSAELPPPSALQAASVPPALIDVGSGAGFPGVLCALLRPDLHVTLVERIGKKSAFLLALRRELGLRYEVVTESAERLAGKEFGAFGIATSRAALPVAEWLALASRLVVPAGWVFAMTSTTEPLSEATKAEPGRKGLTLVRESVYDVGAGPHRIAVLRLASPAQPE